MNWADLFERAEAYETDMETIRERFVARREDADEERNGKGNEENA
jgi:hypothetical protein